MRTRMILMVETKAGEVARGPTLEWEGTMVPVEDGIFWLWDIFQCSFVKV